VRKGAGSFDPAADTIKVLTMHTSKGLEFPVVALVGAGRMPAEGEDEREDAKLFYMCATRAVKWFMIEVVENGKFPHHILKEKKRALATCLCCKK
jgi:ATP-dependent exoDNAse (exonuclease V) beta subunit